MLGKSREYFAKNGVSYWRDLLDKEVNGERYLFGTEGAEWLVPFAPLRGLNEVQAVVKHKSGFQELSEAEWQGLAEGISKILRFYHAQHYTSFNIIITPGPLDDHLDYFNVNLHIVSRPGIQKYGFTDAWAAPYLLWDGEATEEPERLAQKITRYLKK
jgi:galactose-1-phosphate uridylyltransferase